MATMTLTERHRSHWFIGTCKIIIQTLNTIFQLVMKKDMVFPRKASTMPESIGVSLVIVLDCGIKAVDEIAYAKSRGIDFIICDHHVPDDVLPDAVAILNPKLENNPYPFKHLSGCGVGYKFMHAFAISNGLSNMFELDSLLDLVAISIAADIVPLIGENRILTHFGLKRLNSNPNTGLRNIIKICGLSNKEITISDVIFKIGPRINASGRMQSGIEAVELLVSKDSADAYRKAKNIDQYNKDRKELDKRITEEANAILANDKDIATSKKPIVIYNKGLAQRHNWYRRVKIDRTLLQTGHSTHFVQRLGHGLFPFSKGIRYLQSY